MKQKFTKKLFFGTILVFLVLLGCQQDDFGNKGSLTQQDDLLINIKKIPFSKVKENPKAMEQLKGLIPKEVTKEGIAYRVVYSEDYRISIDTANVMYIEKVGGGHSYSLEAIDEEGHYGKEGELKNLVLNFESNDNSYSKYVLSYNLTDEELYKWKNNEGGINLPERTTFFRIGGNPSGFVLNKPDCWESVMVAQDFPCASGQHMPGDPDCVYIGTVFAAFQTMTIEVISVGCGDGGGSGGGGGGSGNGEGNDGNGNDNGGDGPGFADQDGDPIVTTPIKGTGTLDTDDEEEPEEDKNCEKLNEITNNPALKEALEDLEDKTVEAIEYGYKVAAMNGSLGTPAIIPNNLAQPDQLNMNGAFGGFYVGAFHTHWDPFTGMYPMFSATDLRYLYLVAEHNTSTNKDYSDFFFTLTTVHGTYAIKIKDFVQLEAAFDPNGNIGLAKIERQIKDKYDKRNPQDPVEDMIVDLLEVMKDLNLGVDLYEANENLTNWEKITLNESSAPWEEPIVKTPCN